MNQNFQAEWHAYTKRDDCISLWDVSLKRETILQMTQQILPKATLTYALRCCHSMELKTHRGPLILFSPPGIHFCAFYFLFLEQSSFLLKPPFCRIRRIQTKCLTFGNENTRFRRWLRWNEDETLRSAALNSSCAVYWKYGGRSDASRSSATNLMVCLHCLPLIRCCVNFMGAFLICFIVFQW